MNVKALSRLRGAVTAVALTAGLSGVAIAAPATSSEVSAHGNACTNAPDSGPVWDFHDACHTHDDCYADKPYGNSQWGRLQCDNDFWRNMMDSCNDDYGAWNPARYACRETGDTYFTVVVAAGWAYWN